MRKVNQYVQGFVVLLFCCFCVNANAQTKCTLLISQVDANNIGELKLQTSFNSPSACLMYVSQLPSQLASQGYISASVDSIKQDTASVRISLFVGKKYTWNFLEADNDTWHVLNELGFAKQTFNTKPFDPNKVNVVYEKLLDYYSQHGFPFTKISLDSIDLNNGLVSAKLVVDKGFIYHIDSIRVYGNLKISQDFLHRYLDIPDHDIYNSNKLDKINTRLLALPYVQQSKLWDITMLGSGAILNLYLEPRHSNEVYALVGFLPANEQAGGKLLLTGQVTLNLKNAFGAGENIGVNWQQLQPRSPQLNLIFQRPYLFHSPFGIDFNFSLYKLDSSYLNINTQLGLQYQLSPQQSGKIVLQQASTNVLTVDTLAVIATKTLPVVADVSSVSLGLQYNLNTTDYPFNPRRGNVLQLFAGAGEKHVKENNSIVQLKDSGFNYSSLYDTVKLKAYEIRVRVSASHYFPVAKQATVLTSVNAGIYQSPSYYDNELFQIGGYKLLRGFDEESIFANRFAVATAEYHYLLGVNSYLFGFADEGYAHYQNNAVSFSHTYTGLGFGIAFETKTGIFNISYALGKRDDTQFNFQQSKIHLGFVSVF